MPSIVVDIGFYDERDAYDHAQHAYHKRQYFTFSGTGTATNTKEGQSESEDKKKCAGEGWQHE
jgi:hypothetical protein